MSRFAVLLRRWLPAACMLLVAGLPPAMAIDLFGKKPSADDLLDAEQAFFVEAPAVEPGAVRLRWTIADGYYLYRARLKVEPEGALPPGITIAGVDTPAGEIKDDPSFGRTEVWHEAAIATVRLTRSGAGLGAQPLRLRAEWQGCNEPVGVCYPPQSKTWTLELPAATATAMSATAAAAPAGPGATPAATAPAPEPEQDRMARMLRNERFLALPAFFGFGLLLSFTPCVFPMVPILSGLIVGRGRHTTRGHAFGLSVVYVLAMASTYTVAGVVAASFGENLQAAFQHPGVLIAFALLFVALALSMFGLYQLQLPGALQARLSEISGHQRGGDYAGVAIMGLLSALIVGPCVAPPLIGALAVIASTGDRLLGGAALFAMSLGMGVPLLAIGASAGHFLPRAGHWMDKVKAVFGVALLAVALVMLDRVLPAALIMLAWAVLLVVSATYMGALQPIPQGAPWWRTLIKGLGLVLLMQGALLLIGVAAGARDPLRPLAGIVAAGGNSEAAHGLAFRRIVSLAELDAEIAAAGGRPVLLDFYADWCVACKELERDTFPDPQVRARLAGFVRLQADVTANSADDRALLRRYGLVGPPAILIFGADGRERTELRTVGFVGPEPFAELLGRVGS
ncbi:MAG: protein-disulfide reductase DsbD [Proteobacteria bacterium]|nr:protein-disulfide reductase DsbD [Pseudomonadota bacterium]